MKIMKCKNQIRKLLSFLTIICCLAGSALPVSAAGTGSAPAVPRVTFTNRPNESPDLFVTKTVENAVSGSAYAAPEHAAYRFVLKLGGEIAKNVEYCVLDAEGREIIRETSAGRKYPFQTDSAGIFTLEAGQQAWFEYVGTGVVYEVTEMDTYLLPRRIETSPETPEQTPVPGSPEQTPVPEGGQTTAPQTTEATVKNGYKLYVVTGENSKEPLHDEFDYQVRSLAADGYQQKSPSGGSTGEHTILANGNSETFVNRYTGQGTGETTVLEIEKTFSFPTDYERPETPDFTFAVELDGTPYRNEEYTAVNTETGETLSGTTDADGRFTMKGGWKAVFENIPTDVDYKVYEVTGSMPEGWWSTGVTQKSGSTQAPLTAVDFNNSNLSFMVTKRLEDYSKPDIWFRFQLVDEYGNALAGKTYYLYNTTGDPVYKGENGDDFGGIMMSENLSSGLERIRDTDMGEEMVPTIPTVPAVMVNGKEIVTRQTGPDGYFVLKPGEAALFVGMQPGTSYRVSEEKNPAYTQLLPLPENNGIHTVGGSGQITSIDFVNRPVSGEGTLSVTKNLTFENGEGPLNGEEFHFILYKRLMTEEEVRSALDLGEGAGISAEAIGKALQDEKIVLSEIARASILPQQPGGGVLLNDQGGQSMLMQADEGDGYASELSLQNVESRGIPIGGGVKPVPVDRGWNYEAGEKKYQVYVPVEGRIYSVPEGLSKPTYTTGPDAEKGLLPGEFTLKANQTAIFEGIDLDSEYIVREIKLTSEYSEMIMFGQYRPIYDELSAGGTPVDKQMLAQARMQRLIQDGDSGSIQLTFTNSYRPQKVDLHLTKTDENNKPITDKEAHFMLYLNQGKENPVLPETLPDGTEPSRFYYATIEGELTIENLKAGTYWLYELKAPSGYRIFTDPIEINIVRQPEGSLQVTVDGKPYEEYENAPNSVIGGVTVEHKGSAENPGENDRINLVVRNSYFYELPNSGGMGIYWYSIGGMLLMMAAALILYRYKHEGEVLKD